MITERWIVIRWRYRPECRISIKLLKHMVNQRRGDVKKQKKKWVKWRFVHIALMAAIYTNNFNETKFIIRRRGTKNEFKTLTGLYTEMTKRLGLCPPGPVHDSISWWQKIGFHRLQRSLCRWSWETLWVKKKKKRKECGGGLQVPRRVCFSSGLECVCLSWPWNAFHSIIESSFSTNLKRNGNHLSNRFLRISTMYSSDRERCWHWTIVPFYSSSHLSHFLSFFLWWCL